MKLFPRHYKVLNAVNGYSADLYVQQFSGVRSTAKVVDELIKAGYLRRRTRGKTDYGLKGSLGCKHALERTDKGEKAWLKSHLDK